VVEYVIEKILNNEALLLSSFGGAMLYIFLSKEKLLERLLSAASGFLAAIIFAPIAADIFSDGKGLQYYAASISLCGQFIPQLLQTLIKKFSITKIIDKFNLGGKHDDNNSSN